MKFRLGDIAEITMGQSPRSEFYNSVGDGMPFLQGNRTFGTRYPTFDTYTTMTTKKALAGDVIMSVRAPVGDLNFTPVDLCLGRGVCSIRMKNGHQDYLFYLLKYNMPKLLNKESGTVFGSVNKNDIASLEVNIVEEDKQTVVSRYLSMLDEKIEENERINQNLEEQAQALFKSWFVDFEPFGGTMPSDWREYHLSEFLPVITGKKNANVSSDQGKYPFFSCAQDISWTNEYSFDGNAILVAGNGDFNVKWYNGKFEAYQRTYVLIPYEPRFTSWLYYAVKYNLYNITMSARGSVIKFITKGNLEDFTFQAPTDLNSCAIIDTFDSINHAIETRTQENIKLSLARDTLLPKLMSGELDVSAINI